MTEAHEKDLLLAGHQCRQQLARLFAQVALDRKGACVGSGTNAICLVFSRAPNLKG